MASKGAFMTDDTETGKLEEAAAQREFDRQTTIFEQDCQEFRSLNGFLWQIPVIVSTLTGGLWFGATKVDDSIFIQASLFLLAAAANICFIIVLWRLRAWVMEPLLERITAYQGRPRSSGKYTMIIAFSALLLFSSAFSLAAFAIKVAPLLCKSAHAAG
jgi:hypothetical protein